MNKDKKIQKLMKGVYDIRREAEDPPIITKTKRKSAIEVVAPPIDVPDISEPPKSKWRKFAEFVKSKFRK